MKIKQLTSFKLLITSIFLSLVLISFTAYSQTTNNTVNKPLAPDTKAKIVEKIARILKDSYVLPAEGKLMHDYIKACFRNGYYDDINDPSQFADTLTGDLLSICKDKHLSINYDPETKKMFDEGLGKSNDPDNAKEYSDEMKKDNYGFKKVERLSGNIGYIDIRSFSPPEESKETVASVMEFLSNSDAVIIDLRKNGGGSPYGVQLLCSYFFGPQAVHLNDIFSRNNLKEEFWTLPDIEGKRMPDMPVYILTGSYTFSAAEEFAYDLKVLKRATIVGEPTRGGANSGGITALGAGFVMFVSKGRALNPETKTNWEGTGVQPDVPITSDKALEQAEIMALEQISGKSPDEKEKKHIEWMIESLKGALNPPETNEALLKNYAGIYEDRKITFENGSLYYQRNRNAKFRMTSMAEDMFMFDELESFRIIFLKDSKGKVTGLMGIYDDGHADKSKRTN